MSVLDSIRRGTDSTAMRLVFGAIVVVFVFWGVGSGAGTTGQSVAEVNGERISDEDFRRARQQRTDGMSLSDDEQLKAIEREVLDSLVRSEVLRQEAQAAGLQVSDGLPTNAERADSVLIPAERLSVGAAVSLSLAVRVALAESTLVNGSAMLLLDDPLVDLDESRRRLAAKLLAKLGEKMQVVILTCHDHHAAELGPARIEVTGV